MGEINNIADTTGRAEYKCLPTKVCPDMEQLYFELEDKDSVFDYGKRRDGAAYHGRDYRYGHPWRCCHRKA